MAIGRTLIPIASTGGGGGTEIAYQRLYPASENTSYTTGDTPWHLQNGSYDYNYPSGSTSVFAKLDNNASESQVRSAPFYGRAGDGSDSVYPTVLENTNAFGNKFRFTDDAGNESDSSDTILFAHTDFRKHSFTGATSGYVIDHLYGVGFNIDYYQTGSVFNMNNTSTGVNWEVWMDYINNANYVGFTDWRPYSIIEMASCAIGAYLAGGGLVYPWSNKFFTAEATQGGTTRFALLTGETDSNVTTNFIYGEDSTVVDITDDIAKVKSTSFPHRLMNCFIIRNHY